jgi:lysophospholipase L1-like esterase
MSKPTNTNKPDAGAMSPKKPLKALSWKARIGLIALGTFAGLVLLEVGLRSAGLVYHFERQYEPGNHDDDAYVILCVGDSCTFGQGASRPNQKGYPAQLERLLRTHDPEKKFKVVNMGFPGANSSQLARRFEGFVRLHNPDLAIILIGNNDIWNRNESRIHLFADGRKSDFGDRLATRLRVWSDELRIVRLARCIAVSVDDDREDEWNPDEDTSPSRRNFERGADIIGEIENVERLYRFNFAQISEIAEKASVDLLWLDYHLGAKFGETDYIDPVLEDLDAPYLDLFPYFHNDQGETNKKLICTDNWHPNDAGYTVFARAIYNKLIEIGVAEGPTVGVLEGMPRPDRPDSQDT